MYMYMYITKYKCVFKQEKMQFYDLHSVQYIFDERFVVRWFP